LTRAKDFPPDLAPIKVLEVYGRSLVSTKGDEWKIHRRLVNNGLATDAQVLAWEEGSFQAEGLVQHWLETGGTAENLRKFTTTLVLHVLSRSFYGKRRYWATEEEVPPNHTMSFSGAKRTLLQSLKLIAILPRPLLTRLPFASTKAAAESYDEWSAYMKEMRQDILDHADERMKNPKKSLLGKRTSPLLIPDIDRLTPDRTSRFGQTRSGRRTKSPRRLCSLQHLSSHVGWS
jgi:cytochrome P450